MSDISQQVVQNTELRSRQCCSEVTELNQDETLMYMMPLTTYINVGMGHAMSSLSLQR